MTIQMMINSIVEWTDEKGSHRERILRIAPDGRVATISLDDKDTGMPVWRALKEIVSDVESENARLIIDEPGLRLSLPESEIPSKERQIRDERWEAIALLVENTDDKLFDPAIRGARVQSVARGIKKSRKYVYFALRLFWQRGQCKNALLPDFQNCGTGEKQIGNSKRGRKSAVTLVTGEPTGVNVDAEMRELILLGYKEFYLRRGAPSLRQAHQRTLETYFVERLEERDGIIVPILLPDSKRPTFDQFRYHGEQAFTEAQKLKKRKGGKVFRSNYREILGDSTQMAYGPGSIYQFDATLADVNLVAEYDRQKIIGRPEIYLVIDVFSRQIVGFGVSLENAGWSGAMLALENAFTDKVTFCSEHNVSISKNQWPAEHLPSSIIGDRGEMEGFAADALASRLGIEVLNTPAYRPDLKGIVESSFGFINEHLFRQLPGAVRKDEEYGRPDSRLDASLTLNGLRKAMIHYVLWHNRTHRIASYPFSEDMIADNVAPYPNELWHWGIENRSGQLRAMDQKTVRMSLLPFKKDGAAVTRSGIVFNKLHYTCTLAEQEGWYVNARSTGRTRVDVIYDPRDTRKIFLAIGHPVKLLACDLVERDNVFAGKDWYDVEQYFKRVSTSPQMEKSRDLQSTAEYHAAINAIIGEATTQREFDVPDRSKTQRIMDISENRAAEREVERKDTSWVQGLDDDSDISTVEASTTVESEYVAPPNYLNQFSEFADRNDLEEPT